MTRYRFWDLSDKERRRWRNRLLFQWGVALERVVQFEHLGPLIWSISEYERDQAGRIAVSHGAVTLIRRRLFEKSVS